MTCSSFEAVSTFSTRAHWNQVNCARRSYQEWTRGITALWDKTKSFWGIQSFTFPRAREWASERMNERSGACKQSEQGRATERVSSASEWANRRASGPVLTSRFLFVPDHSAPTDGYSPKFALFTHKIFLVEGSSYFRVWWFCFGSSRPAKP